MKPRGGIIYIKLDFSGKKCNLGHSNAYTEKKCEVCGEDLSELEPDIDPKVKMRKLFMSPTFVIIESKIQERKSWFKKLRKQEVSKIVVDEPFETINELIHRLNMILSENVLNDVAFYADNLDDDKVIYEIERFNDNITSLFDIKLEAEKLKLTTIWKNMNRRLVNSIGYFIDGYVDLINTTVSSNLAEAQNLERTSQEKIDFATNEINILGRIINNEETMVSTDIFNGGEVNQSAMASMIFFNNNGNITETIQETNIITGHYFKELINQSFQVEDIIYLAPYMYMGTSVFDDEDYFRKIRVVINVLDKAMTIDKNRFKIFFSSYLNRFLYAKQKVTDIATDLAFVYGNTPSDEMLMRHSIKWYKDLSEGIYRDSSRLIFFGMNILNGKSFDNDDILTWLGFGDIVGEFENQSKHKLHHLTEGVVKIIRHAEAHVDYDIKDGYVNLRNIMPHKKITKEVRYTYEEFFDITNKLAETVFAIICGIHIHLYNNSNDFSEELKIVAQFENDTTNADMTAFSFALNGIIILHKQINGKVLNIEGVLKREVEQKDVGEILFNACAHNSLFSKDIDEICFNLYDADNQYIGSVIVPMKHLYKYHEDESDFKEYNLLITRLTSQIDEKLQDNVINDSDLICLKSIFVYLMEICQKINHAFRDKDIKFNQRIKSELQTTQNDLINLNKFLVLYKEYSSDEVLFNHKSSLVNQVQISLNHITSSGILSGTIQEDFRNLKIIADSFPIFLEYSFGEKTKMQYLQEYLSMKPYLPKTLSVNSPCPCGSGKKFKKCCLKLTS